MLRDESLSKDRPWPASRRAVSALLLLAVAGGVLILQGPVRGDDTDKVDDKVKTVKRESPTSDKVQGEPFDLTYVPDGAQGFVALRPRATFARAGMGTYRTMLNLLIAKEWSKAANQLGVDPAKSGQGPLRVEMFEQVMGLVSISQHSDTKPRWRLMLGDVIAARTNEPVDWVKLCRAFKIAVSQAHEGDNVFYRIDLPAFGPEGSFYCPNDRTIVFASEKRLRHLLRRNSPIPVAYAKGKDWDHALHGLCLVAFDSRDGVLRKAALDGDAEVAKMIEASNLFKDGGLLTFSLDDRDDIMLGGSATLGELGASEATARAFPTFLKALREAANQPVPDSAPLRESHELARRMWLDLLTNCRVERDGSSVSFRSSGLGTIADFASLIAAGVL